MRVPDAVQAVSLLPQVGGSGFLFVPGEGFSQIGTQQLTEAEEPSNSLSEEHGKFHIANSDMLLTLACGA